MNPEDLRHVAELAQSREPEPETLGRHLGCRTVISGTVAGSPASLNITLIVTESATGRVTATHSVSAPIQRLDALRFLQRSLELDGRVGMAGDLRFDGNRF
jgi:hypothetical protein